MKQIISTYGTHLYDGNKNISIVLFIADRCNYSCVYCGNKFPRTNKCLDLTITYENIISLFQTINGKLFLDILGGEPLLHPDLYSFCQKLSQHKRIIISIYTNFSADKQMYIKLIQMGIHIVPSWHSLPNNLSNSKFIENVFYVANYTNTKISCRVMYEPFASTQSIDAFNQLNLNRNVNVEFSLLSDSQYFKIQYTSEQMYKYMKKQSIVNNKNNDICIVFNDGTTQMVGFYEIFKHMNFRFWKCYAGVDSLYIHSDGNVYPCPKFYTDSKKPLFNMYQETISLVKRPLICTFKHADCECDKEIKKQYMNINV